MLFDWYILEKQTVHTLDPSDTQNWQHKNKAQSWGNRVEATTFADYCSQKVYTNVLSGAPIYQGSFEEYHIATSWLAREWYYTNDPWYNGAPSEGDLVLPWVVPSTKKS